MVKDDSGSNQSNSLKLTMDRLNALLDELDAMDTGTSVRRDHARLEYRRHALELQVMQPNGGSVSFHVACRNLSRGGVGVLHSSFMHEGTRCRVHMHHKTSGDVWLEATVTRCRHVAGRVHEVGLRFAQEIDVRQFAGVDPLSEQYSLEKVDPGTLEGRVLLVTGYDMDRKLVEVYLGDTGVRLVCAKDYDELADLLEEPFDVLLCDFDLDSERARLAVEKLRQDGKAVPVVAMSSDVSSGTRSRIRAANATGFLAKPLQKTSLLRALGEFMVLKSEMEEAAEVNDASEDPSMAALAELFEEDLKQFAIDLRKCLLKKDDKTLRYICARIKGTGPLLGHASAAVAADKILTALNQSGSVDGAATEVNALIDVCSRTRAA